MKTIFFSLLLLLLSFDGSLYAASEKLSKQQAVDIATRAHPGRVLAVRHKADVYKVKTLSDSGKVHIIIIDDRSGKIRSAGKPER